MKQKLKNNLIMYSIAFQDHIIKSKNLSNSNFKS